MFQVNMATECQVGDCHRATSAFCYCCKNNVCTNHFLEHIELMKAKIDPLANEVNNIIERIQSQTIENLSRPIFTQLNEWKTKMYESIDDIHRKRTKDIERIIHVNKDKFEEHNRQQSEAMGKLQAGVTRIAEDGDINLERMESLETQLKVIESNSSTFEKSFLSIDTRMLGEGWVTVSSKFHQPSAPVKPTKPKGYLKSSILLFDYEKKHLVSFLVPKIPPYSKTSSCEQPKPLTSSGSVGQSDDAHAQPSASTSSVNRNASSTPRATSSGDRIFGNTFASIFERK